MKTSFILRSILLLTFFLSLIGCIKAPLIPGDDESPQFQIGDYYQGGIIFHVDETGEHGLILGMRDVSEELVWTTLNDSLTKANSMSNGKKNTEKIIEATGESLVEMPNYAALACARYSNDDYNDWYLPAVDELYYLFQKVGNDGTNRNDNSIRIKVNKALEEHNGEPFVYRDEYWTSTEVENNLIGRKQAYAFRIADPDSSVIYNPPFTAWKKDSKFRVRAIRKF